MFSVRVRSPSPRCEVESSVFTTPDVSPVAEYDVGKLLDLHMDLKQLSLKYNCLQKIEPSSNPSSYSGDSLQGELAITHKTTKLVTTTLV